MFGLKKTYKGKLMPGFDRRGKVLEGLVEILKDMDTVQRARRRAEAEGKTREQRAEKEDKDTGI